MSKLAHSNQKTMDEIELMAESEPGEDTVFFHATPDPDACKHDFQGWRPIADGNGGEQVCTKCGIGAFAYSLRTGF